MTTLASILGQINGANTDSFKIPENWMQGRSTYGGLSAAIGLTACNQLIEDDAPLRSLMVNFVGPLGAGNAAVNARFLRKGKSVSQATAEITNDGATATQVTAVYGHARDTDHGYPAETFDLQPRDAMPHIDTPQMAATGMLPRFAEQFNLHWNSEGVPMTGSKSNRLGIWISLYEEPEGLATERLVALADMPPPIMMSHYTRMVKASSITWSLELLKDPRAHATKWLHLDYSLEYADGGYSIQSGRISNEHGELLAMSRQNMAYFD